MTEELYVERCKRTLSSEEDVLGHMIIGISTEAGELLDAYKKHKYYGRDLDIQNVKEEIGDLCWYLFQLAEEVGYSIEEAQSDNLYKLLKRYPHKFEDVLNRNQKEELNHIGEQMKVEFNREEIKKTLVRDLIDRGVLIGNEDVAIKISTNTITLDIKDKPVIHGEGENQTLEPDFGKED